MPRHRGRDAVKWTIKFGDTISGGTVYQLSDKVDGGSIICRDTVLVKKSWTYKDLSEKALVPMGVDLILKALKQIDSGAVNLTPQDEELATWEPPIEPTRLHRPELIRLE